MRKIPIVLGTGPSLAKDIDLIRKLQADGRVMLFGLNDTYRDFNLDVWIACDPKWHEVRGEVYIPFCDQWHWDKAICEKHGYEYIEGVWYDGLWTKDTEKISYGHSSGWQALNLAHHYITWDMCQGPILLCGFDMTYRDNEPRHYFTGLSDVAGEYDKELRKWSLFDKTSKGQPGKGLLFDYKRIADQCERGEAHQIINCTPGSAMEWFPISPLSSAICDIMDLGKEDYS